MNETLYRLPYRVTLAEDETWRYAPFDVSTWTDVRALNLDDLERKERFSDLREQVRIERAGRARGRTRIGRSGCSSRSTRRCAGGC